MRRAWLDWFAVDRQSAGAVGSGFRENGDGGGVRRSDESVFLDGGGENGFEPGALDSDAREAGDLFDGSGKIVILVDVDGDPIGIMEAVADGDLECAGGAIGGNENGVTFVHEGLQGGLKIVEILFGIEGMVVVAGHQVFDLAAEVGARVFDGGQVDVERYR